ncbi:hypothetical protein YN1_8050 [Nanoarchaeota archaeon]
MYDKNLDNILNNEKDEIKKYLNTIIKDINKEIKNIEISGIEIITGEELSYVLCNNTLYLIPGNKDYIDSLINDKEENIIIWNSIKGYIEFLLDNLNLKDEIVQEDNLFNDYISIKYFLISFLSYIFLSKNNIKVNNIKNKISYLLSNEIEKSYILNEYKNYLNKRNDSCSKSYDHFYKDLCETINKLIKNKREEIRKIGILKDIIKKKSELFGILIAEYYLNNKSRYIREILDILKTIENEDYSEIINILGWNTIKENNKKLLKLDNSTIKIVNKNNENIINSIRDKKYLIFPIYDKVYE